MRILVFLILIFAVVGCSDFEDISLKESTVNLAIPVINTTMKINDFTEDVKNTTLIIDEDGKITLKYKGEVTKNTINDIIINKTPLITIPITDTSYLVSDIFDPKHIIKKAIASDDSEMVVVMTNQYEESVDVELDIPDMYSESGEAIHIEATVAPGETFQSEPLDISGYNLIPVNKTISVNYQARRLDGELVLLDEVLVAFKNLGFRYLEGYFGNNPVEIEGNFLTIGIFDEWIGGSVNFEDPSINIIVNNSFGFPVRGVVEQLDFVNADGETNMLQGDFIEDGFLFNYPGLDEVGETKQTTIMLNNSNSNLKDVINKKTVKINYDFDAFSNPEADTSIIGFAEENSYFDVNVEALLPLYGNINNLKLRDTISYTIEDLEDINSAKLKIITENGFPLDVDLNIYQLDDSGNELYNVLGDPLTLSSAALNDVGDVIETFQKVDTIQLTEMQIINFQKYNELILEVSISTKNYEAQNVWIRDSYNVNLKLGAIVNIDR